MQNLAVKLRCVYLPFLAMATGFAAAYTFLDWLLFIQLDLLPLKQEVLELWLPMLLPWAPILIWLRPRINLLSCSTKRHSGLLLFTAWIAIAFPSVFLQMYLYKAAGEMTNLASIADMAAHKETKFYTLQNFYIDKQNAGAHAESRVSGRYNDNFNMYIYIAVPIWEKRGDAATRATCPAWLGIKYSKTISNRQTNDQKEQAFEEFGRDTERAFAEKDPGQFAYLERTGRTDDADAFQEALKHSPKYGIYNTTVLLPDENAFNTRGEEQLRMAVIGFAIGAGAWLLVLLLIKTDPNAIERFNAGTKALPPDKASADTRKLLTPSIHSPASLIIIYANLLVIIAMILCGLGIMSFKSRDLLAWGANFRPLVAQGEWWRLVTSMFIHDGLAHITANTYGLFLAGMLGLEPLIGRLRFVIAYFVCGIAASCASIWWHADTVSVGASGAIFGLYGILFALALTNTAIRSIDAKVLALNLAYAALSLSLGFVIPGVDNAAHIGGFVTGIMLGLLFSIWTQQHPQQTNR